VKFNHYAETFKQTHKHTKIGLHLFCNFQRQHSNHKNAEPIVNLQIWRNAQDIYNSHVEAKYRKIRTEITPMKHKAIE